MASKTCNRRQEDGVILPSLILLSLILVTLSAILLSSGTSSLRLATQQQNSEQAYLVAEAGLVRAAATYAKTGVPKDTTDFSGKMEESDSSFVVSITSNPSATDDLVTAEGISIPPMTTYLLSTGTTSDGTQQRVGGLFTLGTGAFRAGVLANNVVATNSKFFAYSSLTNTQPNPLLPGQGILTSNGSSSPGKAQFELNTTTVEGRVYVARGTSPLVQIEKNNSKTEYDSSLGEDIDIPDIVVPKLERGKSGPSSKDDEPQAVEENVWKKLEGAPSTDALWNGTGWVFHHKGSNYRQSEVLTPGSSGTVQTGNLQVRFSSQNGMVEVKHGSGSWKPVSLPVDPLPSVEDPGTLEPGAYGKVTITKGDNVLQEGGMFVVRDLEIAAGGQLALDSNSPVSLYVTNSLKITGENAIANASKMPPNLKIYYTGPDEVSFEGGSQSYFTLIAPKATINLTGPDTPVGGGSEAEPIDSDGENTVEEGDGTEAIEADEPKPTPTTAFYGALIGKVVNIKNAAFYFDIATDGIGEGVDGNTFSLLSRHRL